MIIYHRLTILMLLKFSRCFDVSVGKRRRAHVRSAGSVVVGTFNDSLICSICSTA